MNDEQFVIEAWFSDDTSTVNLAARYGTYNVPRQRPVKHLAIEDPEVDEIVWAMRTLMRAYLGDHGFWQRYEREQRVGRGT